MQTERKRNTRSVGSHESDIGKERRDPAAKQRGDSFCPNREAIMQTTAERTVRSLFQKLDAPDALLAGAAEGNTPSARPRVNAHIHLPPNFSAFDTVDEAVKLAADQGIGVLGASNYYDYRVYADFAKQASRRGIFPLFGIEIITLDEELVRAGIKVNDPGNPGKMYLCGKGIAHFDPLPPDAAELLGVIRTKDSERMARLTARLAELFAAAGLYTGLDEDAIKNQVVSQHGSPKETVYLQERHVAQAFQEALFELVSPGSRGEALTRLFCAAPKSADDADAVQNDIRSYLMKAGKPAYVQETFVGFDHAYRLILALGGIPSYPTLADGASPICAFETPVENLIASIKARGIHCAELIPVRNNLGVLAHYVHAMRQAGFILTAGTEHNTRDMLPIEPTCVNGQPISDEIGDIFWEGACVVAAHQYLVLRGEPGYVDAKGRLNASFATTEERITAFHTLGASVIDQYQRTHRPTGNLSL